jgi:hypothetical protein
MDDSYSFQRNFQGDGVAGGWVVDAGAQVHVAGRHIEVEMKRDTGGLGNGCKATQKQRMDASGRRGVTGIRLFSAGVP